MTGALIYFDPGLPAISGFIGAILAFLTTFDKKTEALDRAEPSHEMSQHARRVLTEIESSSESDPKGVSLMMMGNVLGLYRPFIWNNHIHGAISGNDGYDTTGVVSAIDELVGLGFLVPHYVGDSLLQWRRTTRQQS